MRDELALKCVEQALARVPAKKDETVEAYSARLFAMGEAALAALLGAEKPEAAPATPAESQVVIKKWLDVELAKGSVKYPNTKWIWNKRD